MGMVKRTTTLEEAYAFSDEVVTGANALAQQGYGSYNPWIYEEHRTSYDGGIYTRNPIEGFFVTFGKPLKPSDTIEIDGRSYTKPFWAMYDLWYSQTDDTVITEGLEDFECGGILDDFLNFCLANGMSGDVYNFNVRKYIKNEQLVPMPDILDYPLAKVWNPFEEKKTNEQLHKEFLENLGIR